MSANAIPTKPPMTLPPGCKPGVAPEFGSNYPYLHEDGTSVPGMVTSLGEKSFDPQWGEVQNVGADVLDPWVLQKYGKLAYVHGAWKLSITFGVIPYLPCGGGPPRDLCPAAVAHREIQRMETATTTRAGSKATNDEIQMKTKVTLEKNESNHHGTQAKGQPWNQETVHGWKLRCVDLLEPIKQRERANPEGGKTRAQWYKRFILYFPSGKWYNLDVALLK